MRKRPIQKKELDDNIGASSIFFSVVENI
jgi:hypothetical protein